MISTVFKCVLVFLVMLLESQAFWWESSTTESPVVSVKHIPLTYFRTYTYQPLPGGPFSFPFGYGGPAQTPILNGGRYEHFQFPPNQHFAGGSLLAHPMPYPSKPATTTTTTQATVPTTQSTTTTTTTPAPTTAKSTSTTTTTTTSQPQHQMQSLINAGGGTFGAAPQYEPPIYPTYNRRHYMNNYNEGNYYRPHYPYPDYATSNRNQRPSSVQFVPCMCPVSVGVTPGLPIVGAPTTGVGVGDLSPNFYMPQVRINAEDDTDMELPIDEDEAKQKQSAVDELSDQALLSDDSQTIVLETNKIDGQYRKRQTESAEVTGS